MIKEGRVKKSRKTDDFIYERPLTIYSDKGRGMSKTSDKSTHLAFGNPQIIIRYGRRKLFVLEREILFPDPVSFSFDDHLFGIDKIERTKTTLFC